MIIPTHSDQNPCSLRQQQKLSSKGVSFTDLIARTAAARIAGMHIQRSAVTMDPPEEMIVMGRVNECSKKARLLLTTQGI